MEMKAFTLMDEASGSKVKISLFGATIISWTVKGKERLFLSDKAILDGSKAIRGGIPPVFPVFGKASSGPCAALPQHGFARNNLWTIKDKSATSATLSLTPAELSQETKDKWAYTFELLYSVTIQDGTLDTQLQIHNTDSKDFDFQTLLHTYFRVGDISKVHVTGLNDITYKDKVSATEVKETSEAVTCTSETDRVYPNVKGTVKIYENAEVSIEIERQGLDDVVLWNPWADCHKMGDFAPADGYKRMVCVEAGAVSRWHTLGAGEKYVARQVLTARL
ncbi:putative Aldose 1-epimerase [Taphrina deformans PYCC 5710]|uniref:Glucose-6-phosphate 1-epimerase n=1 Tax=Taphrina deformans (strain PYCC 5710 / ATCC 11124 / CBS 356.35 / IMI 108563 / JCM 9778 / NBRC 8474) TaxID=1097556 RepID=R4X9I4_TAPDE|nr:putative Aldose 1-epimerase [Taphrina deformans PYCC 5710]|eukprot:CCG82380.1 putative Aldose 1-epimerase [Taphrina deformans PYCC 5710]